MMESPLHQQVHDKEGRPIPLDLEDTTCVVTGASRGIGKAIATELGHRGANVVVNYHSSDSAANTVVDHIQSTNGKAMAKAADVSDHEEVAAMFEHVRESFGPIDVLVNNAGITIDRRFDQLTAHDWSRVMEVNLGGPFNCTKACYEDIRSSDHGRVINISSVIGQTGNYGQTNYAASKSALFGFTKSLALELAPHGSTANCVAPGYTRTDMVDNVREDIQDRIRSKIPLDRFATPAEIASVVGFLATKRSSYVTGEIINVNGGLNG